jgi:3-phenylpropionate/cinnamic acid dioxygenase small subunit
MDASHDPARTSWYLDDAYYAALVGWFTDWQRDDRLVEDPAERDRCRALLEREGRLLDQHRYEDWLALFAPECLCWAPATPGGGDPRREVAVCFDDRRRMEDRIFRLRTSHAWSQVPASRTVRLVTNVEVFSTDTPEVRMVRSNFLITELRAGETRRLSGWCGHRLRTVNGRAQVLVKQVNLIDCDRNLRNPSLVL